MAEEEKKRNNRLKSMLVMQFILKHADDENPVSMEQIQNHLEKYGVEADRRGIYKDIAEFTKLMNAELDSEASISERDKLNYEITFTRKAYPNAPQGGYLVHQLAAKRNNLYFIILRMSEDNLPISN